MFVLPFVSIFRSNALLNYRVRVLAVNTATATATTIDSRINTKKAQQAIPKSIVAETNDKYKKKYRPWLTFFSRSHYVFDIICFIFFWVVFVVCLSFSIILFLFSFSLLEIIEGGYGSATATRNKKLH